jgi:hypothetical protein
MNYKIKAKFASKPRKPLHKAGSGDGSLIQQIKN